MASSRRRVRLVVTLVTAFCMLPLLLAAFLNLLAPGWRSWPTSNHGTLIAPPREVRSAELSSLDEQGMGESFFTGKWTLVVAFDPPCDPLCEEQLVKMRQVRLALGKDAPRVQRLLVTRSVDGDIDSRRLIEDFPGLRLAKPSHRWLDALEIDKHEPVFAARIYVIDPLGLLMMYYPPDIDPSLMLKDMKRLLRASRIG